MRYGRRSEATVPVLAYRAKKPLHAGVSTGCHFLISLSACVTFVVLLIARAVHTRPIFINPGSMEAGKYGLTRGTGFVGCRLKVVAVAGLLWISWCVLGATGFRVFVLRFFFFERTRPAASMRSFCFI